MKQPTRGQLREYGLTLDDWKEIVRRCSELVETCYDPNSGEHSPTLLAEAVAADLEDDDWFGVYDWLDDETHPIWGVAVDVCALADAGELDDE